MLELNEAQKSSLTVAAVKYSSFIDALAAGVVKDSYSDLLL
jgi:hypothetical protein